MVRLTGEKFAPPISERAECSSDVYRQPQVNSLSVHPCSIMKQFEIPKVRFDLLRKPEDKILFIQDLMKQNIEKSLDLF